MGFWDTAKEKTKSVGAKVKSGAAKVKQSREKIVEAEKKRHESEVKRAKEREKRQREDKLIAKSYSGYGIKIPLKKKKQGKTLSRKQRIKLL